MKFETKLNKLEIDTEEVKNIINACECGEINGAYFIDLTKEKKEFIMEVVGNYLDDDSKEFEGWTDIKRIATFCKTFDISEDEIPHYYRLGFNEGGEDIAYELESNPNVILVLTEDERYNNSFILSPSQNDEDDDDEEMGFDEYFDLINYEEIPKIVEKLYNPNYNLHLNRDDWRTLRDYHKQLEHELQFKEVDIKNNLHPERCERMYKLLEAEYDEIHHIWEYKVGRNTRVSLFELSEYVYNFWIRSDDKYYDGFFDLKEFVEMLNAYYGIETPHKPANKVAYGLTFAIKKGFKSFRPYFYGCIRNYLQKNNVEFKTLDLQKICRFKDITDEDC